jgi:trans-aconitate methyltransferase
MKINDTEMLKEMKRIIFHDGDVRPVWTGPGLAVTDIAEYEAYARWANEHWGLYRGFFSSMDMDRDGVILDLGCGVGFCTYLLSEHFKKSKIVGYDIDDVSIDFAEKYNKDKNINYVQDNILNSALLKSDYIFLIETLEHLKHEHHHCIIDKCLEALNDGGLLFISTPNENISSTSERGHIGILDSDHFISLKDTYQNNIESIEYYINTNLEDDIPDNYTSKDTGSHYKLVFKK